MTDKQKHLKKIENEIIGNGQMSVGGLANIILGLPAKYVLSLVRDSKRLVVYQDTEESGLIENLVVAAKE